MNYRTKVAFLDVDGVLNDSLPAAYKATVAVFEYCGVTPLSAEEHLREFDACNPVAHYRKRGITISDELIWEKWLEHFNQYDHSVFQEVPEVLRSLHQSGVMLFYVTFSRSKEKVFQTFRTAGILSLFKGGVFGCADKDKYMVDVYENLDIDPRHCAMVGDQPTDIIDADKAGLGLRIGMARNAAGRKKLEPHSHTHIIESLTELYDIL